MRFLARFSISMSVCALVLSACNSVSSDLRFDPGEAAFIRQEGKSTIEGHAFLRDTRGERNVRHAAGEVVRLIPATAYAEGRIAQLYRGRKFVPAIFVSSAEPDPGYVAYMRTTKAESNGRFAFDKVAPGHYFLTTQLIWTPKDALISEGGAIYEEVTVTGKETGPIEVVLSGN